MATRVITWALATEYRNGAYNSSFRQDSIQLAFDLIARYKDVRFDRIGNYNAARVKILQKQRNLPNGAFAQANKGAMRIELSPTAQFGRLLHRCMVVIGHEFFHLSGSSNHLPGNVALMSVNGGNAGNITEADYPYFAVYPWKSTLRPHHEPEYRRQAFPMTMDDGSVAYSMDREYPVTFGCSHGKNRIFQAILDTFYANHVP